MHVGDDVHVGAGHEVGAEELGGVRDEVAVHGRALGDGPRRAELEHPRRLEPPGALAEPVLEVGLRQPGRAGHAEEGQPLTRGARERPGAGAGRHGARC